MRTNKVLATFRQGGTVVNGWCSLGHSYAAEVMAHAGWDSLTIDMQHGPVDYVQAVPMFQAISTTDVVPLARVPWNESGIIMKLLDAGCYGIICPMINTRAECEQFVGSCLYPPIGYRSHGPNRARLYGGADYPSQANNEILVMAMIETRQAVDNLDDILTVEGLNAVYVGPADLAQSYGLPPTADHRDGMAFDAVQKIAERCRHHGIYAGIHVSSASYALFAYELGYQFATLLSDAALLSTSAGNIVRQVREGAGPDNASGNLY